MKASEEKNKKAYARAGVDVDLGNEIKRGIHRLVRQTHGPEVLGKIGGFGGLFAPNFSGLREPVLVANVDGVGTKLKIAFAMDRHDTVGADLVNHCINDIAVQFPDAGSYTSALAKTPPLPSPPATKTLPLGNNVAV